jgi:hypothetical protein
MCIKKPWPSSIFSSVVVAEVPSNDRYVAVPVGWIEMAKHSPEVASKAADVAELKTCVCITDRFGKVLLLTTV